MYFSVPGFGVLRRNNPPKGGFLSSIHQIRDPDKEPPQPSKGLGQDRLDDERGGGGRDQHPEFQFIHPRFNRYAVLSLQKFVHLAAKFVYFRCNAAARSQL